MVNNEELAKQHEVRIVRHMERVNEELDKVRGREIAPLVTRQSLLVEIDDMAEGHGNTVPMQRLRVRFDSSRQRDRFRYIIDELVKDRVLEKVEIPVVAKNGRIKHAVGVRRLVDDEAGRQH